MNVEDFRKRDYEHEQLSNKMRETVHDMLRVISPIAERFSLMTKVTPPSLAWCLDYRSNDAYGINGTDNPEKPIKIFDWDEGLGEVTIPVKWFNVDMDNIDELTEMVRQEFFDYVRNESLEEEKNKRASALHLESVIDRIQTSGSANEHFLIRSYQRSLERHFEAADNLRELYDATDGAGPVTWERRIAKARRY